MGRVSDAKERLIEATTDLIWRESYGAVGVDAICERADVRKGSFYHFFRSKDQLVVAALDAHWQGRKPKLDAIFAADVPPLERFQCYFAYVCQRQLELRRKFGRMVGCFYGSVGTECVENSPVISAKIKAILNEYARYFETAIRDAQTQGVMARGDAASQAQMFLAYVEGVLAQARIHDDPGLVRQLRRSGLSFFGAVAPEVRRRGPRAGRAIFAAS